jgi:CheY-like chemotaxis protein
MNSLKVLLIDDNEDNITLTKMSLEISTNWEIITTTNGIEGISMAESELPDVILLDLIMPEIDGLTVFEILKQNLVTCNIPIIIVTAMVNHKVLTELRDRGVDAIITKPLDPIALPADIAKICNWNLFNEGKKNRVNSRGDRLSSINNSNFHPLRIRKDDSDTYYLIV